MSKQIVESKPNKPCCICDRANSACHRSLKTNLKYLCYECMKNISVEFLDLALKTINNVEVRSEVVRHQLSHGQRETLLTRGSLGISED